jgi:hypothetical protein
MFGFTTEVVSAFREKVVTKLDSMKNAMYTHLQGKVDQMRLDSLDDESKAEDLTSTLNDAKRVAGEMQTIKSTDDRLSYLREQIARLAGCLNKIEGVTPTAALVAAHSGAKSPDDFAAKSISELKAFLSDTRVQQLTLAYKELSTFTKTTTSQDVASLCADAVVQLATKSALLAVGRGQGAEDFQKTKLTPRELSMADLPASVQALFSADETRG